MHGKWSSRAVFGAHPVYILRKVADLIKSIPDGQLQVTLGRAFRQDDLNFHEMLFGICERNCVVGCRGGLSVKNADKHSHADRIASEYVPEAATTHRSPATPAG